MLKLFYKMENEKSKTKESLIKEPLIEESLIKEDKKEESLIKDSSIKEDNNFIILFECLFCIADILKTCK